MATRSFCVQRPAAAGRAVLGAAARSERVLRGVFRIEEVEVRLGQDVAVVESGARSSRLAAAAAPLAVMYYVLIRRVAQGVVSVEESSVARKRVWTIVVKMRLTLFC